MKQKLFKGCGTALLTPFRDGHIDEEALVRNVRRQVAAGVHFLVPLGTTGETPCLSVDERRRVLELTRANADGRPVVVGGGTNSLEGTLENLRSLRGADAYLIVVPYYNKPTQNGLYAYFKEVAAATSKPIVIYNVPGRTGANIEADTVVRLAEDVPNIVAVKEASGRYAQISSIIRRAPEGFSVLSGNDDETLSLMATGASGVISVASNIAPAEMVALTEALLADNMPAARALHHKLSPLFHALFVESNPIPAKAAASLLGLMSNTLRLPLVPASEKTTLLLERVLAGLKV